VDAGSVLNGKAKGERGPAILRAFKKVGRILVKDAESNVWNTKSVADSHKGGRGRGGMNSQQAPGVVGTQQIRLGGG